MRIKPHIVMLVSTFVFSAAAVILANMWDIGGELLPEELPQEAPSAAMPEPPAPASPDKEPSGLEGAAEPGTMTSEEKADEVFRATRQWGEVVARTFVEEEIDALPEKEEVLRASFERSFCGRPDGPCIFEGYGFDPEANKKLEQLAYDAALRELEKQTHEQTIYGRPHRALKIMRILHGDAFVDQIENEERE